VCKHGRLLRFQENPKSIREGLRGRERERERERMDITAITGLYGHPVVHTNIIL
jgi:hypothetical protein